MEPVQNRATDLNIVLLLIFMYPLSALDFANIGLGKDVQKLDVLLEWLKKSNTREYLLSYLTCIDLVMVHSYH